MILTRAHFSLSFFICCSLRLLLQVSFDQYHLLILGNGHA